MTIVSITLPGKLLEQYDDLIKTRGYYSRSEALRDAIRSQIAESEITKMESGEVATTIMVTCEYERKDVDRRIGEVRHEFDDVVVENIHRHIDQKYCLDVLIAEGDYRRIQDLIGRIRGMRGIEQIKAIFMNL